MNRLKVVAINSFAVHGMASLKVSIHLLGTRVLPVPTLLLNGLTNMPHVKKHDIHFEELLKGTFRLVAYNNQKVVLYIGYIANVAQVDTILDVVREYEQHIICIITDPISGDHGKTYLQADVIGRLPELVRISDFAFPNFTELKLLTAHAPDSDLPTNDYLIEFRRLFPSTKLVVTSMSDDVARTGVLLATADNLFHFEHELLSESFGGTGDAFLTYFIIFHFYDLIPVEEALQNAAQKIHERVMTSIRASSLELIL